MTAVDSATTPSPTPSLWKFATEHYTREGVDRLCLLLQDEHAFDVNLLLFCCWYGTHHGIAEPALMQTLYEYSCDWNNNAVQPVRHTRVWLKALIESSPGDEPELAQLREKLKDAELECERHQLEALEEKARAVPPKQKNSDLDESCWQNLELLRQQMEADEAAADALLKELLQLIKA